MRTLPVPINVRDVPGSLARVIVQIHGYQQETRGWEFADPEYMPECERVFAGHVGDIEVSVRVRKDGTTNLTLLLLNEVPEDKDEDDGIRPSISWSMPTEPPTSEGQAFVAIPTLVEAEGCLETLLQHLSLPWVARQVSLHTGGLLNANTGKVANEASMRQGIQYIDMLAQAEPKALRFFKRFAHLMELARPPVFH